MKTSHAILGKSLGQFQRYLKMQEHFVIICQTAEESVSIGYLLREYAQEQNVEFHPIEKISSTKSLLAPYENAPKLEYSATAIAGAAKSIFFMQYIDHYEYDDYRYFDNLCRENAFIVATIVKDNERPQKLMDSVWQGLKSPGRIDIIT